MLLPSPGTWETTSAFWPLFPHLHRDHRTPKTLSLLRVQHLDTEERRLFAQRRGRRGGRGRSPRPGGRRPGRESRRCPRLPPAASRLLALPRLRAGPLPRRPFICALAAGTCRPSSPSSDPPAASRRYPTWREWDGRAACGGATPTRRSGARGAAGSPELCVSVGRVPWGGRTQAGPRCWSGGISRRQGKSAGGSTTAEEVGAGRRSGAVGKASQGRRGGGGRRRGVRAGGGAHLGGCGLS